MYVAPESASSSYTGRPIGQPQSLTFLFLGMNLRFKDYFKFDEQNENQSLLPNRVSAQSLTKVTSCFKALYNR